MTRQDRITLAGLILQCILLLGGGYRVLTEFTERSAQIATRLELQTSSLTQSLGHLAESVDRLGNVVARIEDRQQDHEVRIALLEQQSRTRPRTP